MKCVDRRDFKENKAICELFDDRQGLLALNFLNFSRIRFVTFEILVFVQFKLFSFFESKAIYNDTVFDVCRETFDVSN